MENIRSYRELRVYQAAIDAAMRVFELTKRFPPEERFSMTDQIRRFAIGVLKYWRGPAQAALSGLLREQAQRFRRRSGGDSRLAGSCCAM